MFGKIRRTLRDLRSHTSGNATLLMAIGLPAVVGGSGLAVDISQWYMWKRDLQYAVDQAALAGAWTMTNNSTSVQGTYATRARQEYDANLAFADEFDTTPTIALARYNGAASNNSVLVTATATRRLPFSSFLTGNATTVAARAQATYTTTANWSVCIFATHPSAQAAFKFGGSVSGSTTCGVGTLSNHPTAAMFEAGNTNNDLGNLVAAGGIDSSFSNNGNNRMHPNTGGLSDPYAGISAPSSAGQPSYSYPATCPTATSGYTLADVTTTTSKTYKYYSKSGNSYTLLSNYTGEYRQTDTGGTGTQFNQTVTSTTTTTTGPTESDYVKYGNGSNAVYIKTTTTTTISYGNIRTVPANDGIVRLNPGIYTDINVVCPTQFGAGVYWLSGSIDFGQNQAITGTGGVLFVMTGTAGAIRINSNSNVRLNGITKSQLTSNYSVSESDASKLAGMLIFDKNSTDTLTINGDSLVKLGGTIYVPNRDVKMNGNGSSAGVCMMVAGKTVEFIGNFNIDNICTPSNAESNINIGGASPSVKLVV